jgi:hypothetical protein
VIRIDKAKWRSVLTRSAIVVLVFVLLLEITFVDLNIKANSLSRPGFEFVWLNESDAYALIIESLSNLKYRVDVRVEVISGSALVILNNGSKILIEAGLVSPPPIEITLTRELRYGGFTSQCYSSYVWLNINGSLFKPGSPLLISGNFTFKIVEASFELSRVKPVNANLLYLGPLSASTLSNATYLIDVLNATACGGAVSLTPALIVVGLSGGTIVSLSWSYRVVVA